MIKLTVKASKKYDVLLQRGLLAEAGDLISAVPGLAGDDKKICIITDATVDPLYAGSDMPLYRSLENAGFKVYKYVFPGGEESKSMSTVTDVLDFLAENEFTRKDILLALGGGITGDLTGFSASAFLRGIDFVQVPTSLLAIVDSSVGGKTGVNLKAGKNLAGAFWQPSLVLFDPAVLQTLSEDLRLDGLAETIKAGFIADPDIISLLAHSPSIDDDFLTKLASMAIEVKRRIVEEDERETSKRQLLNLGHTAGHAIEKCSGFSISHGHAVAIGMAIISAAAVEKGLCDKKNHQILMDILKKYEYPLECPYTSEELAGAALQDKKRKGGHITLVIPEDVGKCSLKTIPVEDLAEFFEAGLKKLKQQL